VVEDARDVRLGPLDRLLAEIADRPVPRWDGSRHYAGPRERTIRYLLVLDTVNFSFWGGGGGGYWQLAERLRDAFAAGDELGDPALLVRVTAERLRELLGDLPMLEERARALRELGGSGFDGLVQDTPRSSSLADPGLGALSRLQAVPFHDSARVIPDSPSSPRANPVAMHAAGPVQEMASNPAKFALGGLGLVRARQVWPFHCSLSVALRMKVPLCRCPPTARQAVSKDCSDTGVSGSKAKRDTVRVRVTCNYE